jgi:protein involved in polysaccharide export with SLBB domain
LTVDQARQRIEKFLSQSLVRPEVSVDIAGYNSKTYYIITEGAGFGDGVPFSGHRK